MTSGRRLAVPLLDLDADVDADLVRLVDGGDEILAVQRFGDDTSARRPDAALQWRGGAHSTAGGAALRRAADHLEQVTGDTDLAGTLRVLIDLKDACHCGMSNVRAKRARSAVRKVAQLVDAAGQRVRG